MRKLSVVVVALAFAFSANAQQFDGTWTGNVGRWDLTLTVNGSKARLEMVCVLGYRGASDFNLGADGKVSAYVSFNVAGQREPVSGTVQALQISGGTCGSGTATMTKKSK